MTLRVGLIQTRTPATHEAALAHVAPLVREAAARGAQFILTPEGVNVLQKDRSQLLPTLVSLEDDPVVLGLRDLARELGVWIDVGSALVKREDGKAANRQAVIDPTGAIVATYDKLHMFDVDLPTGETARESATYEPGDRATVVETPLGAFGLTICYDMRFPALRKEMMDRSGRTTFPQIFVGEQHIGGCDDMMALEREGKLDALLAA